MKDKIILFAIGVLVGAVISTGAFYIYTKTTTCNTNNQQMPGGTPPSMSNGQPPARPNDESGQPQETSDNGDAQNNSNTQKNNN